MSSQSLHLIKIGQSSSSYTRNNRRKKRLKIVNMQRFVSTLLTTLFIITLLVFSISSVTGTLVSNASNVEHFVQYTVRSGDTLWDIAQRFNPPNSDSRVLLHDISQINKIANAVIYPGQILNIPYEAVDYGLQSRR